MLELARTHAILGDEDGAIDRLATYLRGLGSWSLTGLMADPVFTDLTEHERYGELIRASSAS